MPTKIGLLLATLLVGVVASGCAKADTGDKGYIDGTGIITRLAVDDRKKPGKVEGKTLDGKKLDLSSYAGKVVVLNVWGSWCPPCREEAPSLESASRQLAPDGVVFVGVNTKDPSEDPGLAFERRFGITYDSLFDPAGRALLAFYGILTPSSIPSTVVIDKHGRVAARILGAVPSTRTLVELVRDVEGGKA